MSEVRSLLVLGIAMLLGEAFASGPVWAEAGREGMASAHPAAFIELKLSSVEIQDRFWAPRRELLRTATLPSQWEQLEAHHDVDNFRILAGKKAGVHLGPVFLDSDLYKWLEAASYVLAKHPEDKELAARVEEISELIATVQMPDGYLDTYYESFAPDRRWTNLWMNHELYCSGHFIEAACARAETVGPNPLLAAATKLADHLEAQFGPGKNEGVPGHEEVELALVRLYRLTGERKYLDLADFFIHQRGRDPHFKRELLSGLRDQSQLNKIVREKRKPDLAALPAEDSTAYGSFQLPWRLVPRILANFASGRYFQADRPLEAQTVAEGHAVRAMYYFTGAADLYLETGEPGLRPILETVWKNTFTKRAYVTGGLGALPIIEGFGKDYELPNRSYTETCAAIGSFFFSWRMLRATGAAKYADQMERALYNAILSGLSLDQKHYFYGNPLTSHGEHERREWYPVACCPPNLARLLASLERYLYGQSPDGIWVHQYVGGQAELELPEGKVLLAVHSGFPWEGRARLQITPERPLAFSLRLRVPGWARGAEVRVNGKKLAESPAPGSYLVLQREWRPGDEIVLEFGMKPRLESAPAEVKENRGKAAILAGPLVYCLEDRDNPGLDVHGVQIRRDPELETAFQPELLGGVALVRGRTRDGKELRAIPYYAWGNRGRAQMEVWISQEN